jgi:hypothetical protein
MSSTDYQSRYHSQPRPRHDSYYTQARDADADIDAYSRHGQPREKAAAMPSASPQHQYTHSLRGRPRKPTWPPAPSVEDATAADTGQHAREGEPPVHTRGTVDQEKVLEELDHPDDRRYVLVSDPSTSTSTSTTHDRRRKSFAERGNMAPIRTDAGYDAPVFTERVSTPYAYASHQKESTAPARAEFLSPEPLTPASASSEQRNQNAKPAKPTSSYNQQIPLSRPSATKSANDVFDEVDADPHDTIHLRAAGRTPARYSFSKSDLQKDDVRTNLRGGQPKPEPRRRESAHRSPLTFRKEESSSSSRDNPYDHSPHSSSSSLNSGPKKPRPAPVETAHYTSSRTSSRPNSPLPRVPSPKVPSRLRESPPASRPSSRGVTRPASPLTFSTTIRPPSPSRVPIPDADWHATYPPVTARDKSRPLSRMGRYDTMPDPCPRIDLQRPSSARPPTVGTPLPYPADDCSLDVFMPSEQSYQFDHTAMASPRLRQNFADSPRTPSTPVSGSPHLRDDEAYRLKNSATRPEDLSRARPTRSNSIRSQASVDDHRDHTGKLLTNFNLDKPLPTCPRGSATSKYDDWYSLQGHRNFDLCPSCYRGVFAGTPFAVHFSQSRFGERPTERFCDFSSPWIRLAWLLTVKQRRASLELIDSLADIADMERPCPGDRDVGSDRVTWYGVADQRDGVHVANFAICSCDKRMIETLWPTMQGYFTRLPSSYSSKFLQSYMCSLRTSSRRFPKYLDLLSELDAEAQDLGQRPNIKRFIQMARDNAFKGECGRNKTYVRKPWLFIPSLPEFTVCEECYDELVWPAYQSTTTPNTIPRLFNKALQLVPEESFDVGSSCCLYSPRMRKVFDASVREADFTYLKRKAIERKRAETRIIREKKDIVHWMAGLDRGSIQWERAKNEIKILDKEWALWE